MELNRYIVDVIKQREIIWLLAAREFKKNNLGSAFGVLWVFAQPVIYLLLVSFVKFIFAGSINEDYPFYIWFLPSVVIWLFISASLGSSPSLFVENSFFLKARNFSFAHLLIAKILADTFVHLILIGGIFCVFVATDFSIPGTAFQVLYYLFAAISLLVATNLFVATLFPFFKDIRNIVGIIIQFGFWASPIFYDKTNLPGWAMNIMTYNPLFYIGQGYRDVMVYGDGVMVGPLQNTVVFWLSIVSLLAASVWSYKRLRPEFGEVF